MIAACRVSYDAVARAVVRVAAENGELLRTSRSAIAHWVAGTAPGERTATCLAEALSRRAGRAVTLEQIGLPGTAIPLPSSTAPANEAAALARADVDHRGFLATAVYTVAGASLPLGYNHEPVARLLRTRAGQARASAAVDISVRAARRRAGLRGISG
jgi:hypothetical protein